MFRSTFLIFIESIMELLIRVSKRLSKKRRITKAAFTEVIIFFPKYTLSISRNKQKAREFVSNRKYNSRKSQYISGYLAKFIYYITNAFILYKHLIGIEPIIFCFEGNRFTDLAKDVKLFKNLFNLPFLLYFASSFSYKILSN